MGPRPPMTPKRIHSPAFFNGYSRNTKLDILLHRLGGPGRIGIKIEVEAVLVCSSTDTHADIAIEAAEAGKHIIIDDMNIKKKKKIPAHIADIVSKYLEENVS